MKSKLLPMNKMRLQCCLSVALCFSFHLLQAQQDTLKDPNGPILLSSTPTYNLLYQVQAKKSTTAAVSQLDQPELEKTLSTTFGGWLSGRLPGLHTYQPSGEPGNDDFTVYVRGHQPMILVDGTPQSFPSINPEQIESITILKDALSTAMLGMRGGNGAILITTKKGQRNQAPVISLNALYGIQQPTQWAKGVNAYDYARLYNEALANEGQAPAYSQADLDAYQNGSDPTGHPNVDWQKELLKNSAPYNRYDLNISGGNRSTRYFADLDYLRQQGLLQEASFNKYHTNADYQRYIIRTNVEVDLSKSLTTALNLFGRIQNTNQPGVTTAPLFSTLRITPSNAYPKLNSDGSLGGNLNYQNNLYGQEVYSGYKPIYERDFKADLMLKLKLDAILKGLWIKGTGAINAYNRETISRNKTFAVYQENTNSAGAKTYSKYGSVSNMPNTDTINSQNRLFYSELSLGYSKTINADHNIDVLVVASNDYRRVNSDLPFSYTGISGKVSYDYQKKYFLDLATAYNGTERFPKSNRYGFFPAAGIGWELTRENFMKDLKWLNYLKLRASYGKSGNANVGYYDYYQYYVTGSGYGFGVTVPSSTTTLKQGALANPNITWEKANKISAGLETSLLNNQLSVSADYFNEKYYDLVQSRSNGSDMLGTAYVKENIGINRYSGVELQANWKQTIGNVSYFVSPNLTIQKSKVVFMAEPQYMFDYMYRTGRPVGQAFGYVSEGLFASQDEIDHHASQGAGIQPGDIKYKDLNNDGVINTYDQTAIGSTKPFMYYGVNTGVQFRGIELQVLLQGVANSNVSLSDYQAFQTNGKGQVFEYQLDHWTPETPNAAYPRLWLGNNANNQLTSSYWITKGDYLRIKNIELAYNFSSGLLQHAKLNGARIYINATNFFTFSPLNSKHIDPEGWDGAYPIMKTIVAGINIKL